LFVRGGGKGERPVWEEEPAIDRDAPSGESSVEERNLNLRH